MTDFLGYKSDPFGAVKKDGPEEKDNGKVYTHKMDSVCNSDGREETWWLWEVMFSYSSLHHG